MTGRKARGSSSQKCMGTDAIVVCNNKIGHVDECTYGEVQSKMSMAHVCHRIYKLESYRDAEKRRRFIQFVRDSNKE